MDENDFVWKPWETFDRKPEKLGIDGPPCAKCRHWYPVLLVGTLGATAATRGVRCCHADEMFRDFSCFQLPKKEVERGRRSYGR